MTEIFQRIRKQYSKYGLKGIIANIMSAVIPKVFTTSVAIVGYLSLGELRNYSFPQKLKIFPLEEYDIMMFKEFCRNSDCTLNNTKILNGYLQNELRAFVATIDNRIVGYFWWTDNRIPPSQNHPHLIRHGIHLMDKEAYTFDFYIIPEYRGGGNAVEFFTMVCLKLKEQGFEKIYGWVAADNKPARWLYQLMGNKEVKVLKTYRICKLILIANNRIFIKNNKLYSSYSFDYRPLLPYSLLRNFS